MKLLIFTQKVDRKDPILGFFHRWIEVFSKHVESLTVVCLYKGEVNLPANVKVLSLGKESGESRLKYIKNFYQYIWNERKNYENVFVHMNQEYVLMGGIFWKIFGKKVFMWRNHHSGSFLTDIAAAFCANVFCTSKFSYTVKYRKTKLMPVGVDLENFKRDQSVQRLQNSLLFLARISPSKNPDLFVKAVAEVSRENRDATATICGDPSTKDADYYENLKIMVKDSGLENAINFQKGVTNTETVKIYSAHQIFVNLSSSGMYDKTIFEAMACGCLILASNDNLRGLIDDDFIFKYGDLDELSNKIKKILGYTEEQKSTAEIKLKDFAREHSLEKLAKSLLDSIK